MGEAKSAAVRVAVSPGEQRICARPPGLRTVTASGRSGCRATRSTRRLRHWRSEEHTSELQSLMRISYAVFCLKKKSVSSAMHSVTAHRKCPALIFVQAMIPGHLQFSRKISAFFAEYIQHIEP